MARKKITRPNHENDPDIRAMRAKASELFDRSGAIFAQTFNGGTWTPADKAAWQRLSDEAHALCSQADSLVAHRNRPPHTKPAYDPHGA